MLKSFTHARYHAPPLSCEAGEARLAGSPYKTQRIKILNKKESLDRTEKPFILTRHSQ
jgi:hypothetical protein